MGDDEFEFNFNRDYLTDKPYFDINYAMAELGFDLQSMIDDDFCEFINDFLKRYKEYRKYYLERDLVNFRKSAHGFKSPFS